MRSTQIILLTVICVVMASALISAAISSSLLRILRLQKPRFRFLCLAIGAGTVAGFLAGVITGALGERDLTSTGILTQAIVMYLMNLLVVSLVTRARITFWSRGGAVCILPWAVVLAALLYYLTTPAYGRVRELEKRIHCQACIKQVAFALQFYAEDHDGKRPETLQAIVETYLKVPELLVCPATSSSQYEYDAKATLGPRGMVMWDGLGNHKDGRNVLLGNGDVLFLTEEEFQVRKKQE